MVATPEISRVTDKTHVQTQSHNDSTAGSIAAGVWNEMRLLGQGALVGTFKSGKDAITQHTGNTLINFAETVGIGAGISIAIKSGNPLLKLAGAAAGAYFTYKTFDWVKNDVFDPHRLTAIGSAMSDAWHPGANMNKDIATMQTNAGQLGFDSVLMLGGGALGARLGGRFADRMNNTDFSNVLNRSGLRALDLQPARASITDLESQMRTMRTDVKTTDPFGRAQEIIEPGRTSYGARTYSGGNLGDMIKRAQMDSLVSQDAHALALKGQMESLVGQGNELQSNISSLDREVASLRQQLSAAQGLARENQAVKDARTEVQKLEQQESGLAQQRAQKTDLEAQLAAAKQAAGQGNGKGEAAGKVQTLQGQVDALTSQIAQTEKAVDRNNQNSPINQAIARLQAAESALAEAKHAQTGRVEALNGQITAKQAQLDALKQQHQALGQQVSDLVSQYEARRQELFGDQSKLVKAQTTDSKPAPKAKAKAPKAEQTRVAATAAGSDTAAATARTEVTRSEQTAPQAVRDTQPEVSPAERARLEATARATAALDSARPLVQEVREKFDSTKKVETQKKEAIRSLNSATEALQKIETGKTTFADEAAKQKAIEDLQARQAKARADMQAAQDAVKNMDRGPYFKAMTAVRNYAAAAENYIATDSDMASQSAFAKQAVKNLEGLLDELPNSRNGVKPPADNLSRRGGQNDLQRLSQIREHLDNRLSDMNSKHEARNRRVVAQPAVSDAFNLVRTGQLREALPGLLQDNLAASQERIASGSKPKSIPDKPWAAIQRRVAAVDTNALASDPANLDKVLQNSTVVFFDREGRVIQDNRGDGKVRARYFDVPKILNGDGRGGAGVDRLQGEKPVGYAVIAPRVRVSFDGTLELEQIGKKTNGDPIVAKDVLTTGGTVPEGIVRGTSLGRILADYKNARVTGTTGNGASGDATVQSTEQQPQG